MSSMKRIEKTGLAVCAVFAVMMASGAVASGQCPGRGEGVWQGNRRDTPQRERTFASPVQEPRHAAPAANQSPYRPQYQPPHQPHYQPAPPPVFRGQTPPPVAWYPAPPPPPRPNIIAEIIHLFNKH